MAPVLILSASGTARWSVGGLINIKYPINSLARAGALHGQETEMNEVMITPRAAFDFGSMLSDSQQMLMNTEIRAALLGFEYWLDQPGFDSLCYWSENHQILFATAEYLAGKLDHGMDLNLILSRRYVVPGVLRAVAADFEPAVIKASTGLARWRLAQQDDGPHSAIAAAICAWSSGPSSGRKKHGILLAARTPKPNVSENEHD
jgi:hypothetical protein